MRVLVIGAAGRVGSAALAACLAKRFDVTAFVRNPAKLAPEIRNHPRLRIIKGDAVSHLSLKEAIRDQDAVIQAAVCGSNSAFGKADRELVTRYIVKAIKEVQAMRRYGDSPIRLWVVSGQVLLDIPSGNARSENDMMPIHPQLYHNYDFLQQEARDLDSKVLCPGNIDRRDVRVLLYTCG